MELLLGRKTGKTFLTVGGVGEGRDIIAPLITLPTLFGVTTVFGVAAVEVIRTLEAHDVGGPPPSGEVG